MADFRTRFQERRKNFQDFACIIDQVRASGEDVGGFVPSEDSVFWEQLNQIEAAGKDRDEQKAAWLAGFTQVDDLGPNGRAMFLAFAALEALKEMPAAALREAKALYDALSPDAGRYRKVGICKILEVSAAEEAMAILAALSDDRDPCVQKEARWSFQQLLAQI